MEGRETMRRTGSPLQGEDLGGRRRTDGEGQNDESNPLASPAAAPSSTIEMAEVITRVMEERERGRNPQSGTSSRIEIRHKTDMQTWTGVFTKGESVEIALCVFKSSVFGWLNGEGLDGVLEHRDEIPVGDPDADILSLIHI